MEAPLGDIQFVARLRQSSLKPLECLRLQRAPLCSGCGSLLSTTTFWRCVAAFVAIFLLVRAPAAKTPERVTNVVVLVVVFVLLPTLLYCNASRDSRHTNIGYSNSFFVIKGFLPHS